MIRKRFTVVKASFGDIHITVENDRIVCISPTRPHVLSAMQQDDLPLLIESARILRQYLNGDTSTISLPLLPSSMPFTNAVYETIQNIPYGTRICAEEIAETLKKPHAVRAVESICRDNPFSIAVPTHRVQVSGIEPSRRTQTLPFNDALYRLEKRYLDKEFKRQ